MRIYIIKVRNFIVLLITLISQGLCYTSTWRHFSTQKPSSNTSNSCSHQNCHRQNSWEGISIFATQKGRGFLIRIAKGPTNLTPRVTTRGILRMNCWAFVADKRTLSIFKAPFQKKNALIAEGFRLWQRSKITLWGRKSLEQDTLT